MQTSTKDSLLRRTWKSIQIRALKFFHPIFGEGSIKIFILRVWLSGGEEEEAWHCDEARVSTKQLNGIPVSLEKKKKGDKNLMSHRHLCCRRCRRRRRCCRRSRLERFLLHDRRKKSLKDWLIPLDGDCSRSQRPLHQRGRQRQQLPEASHGRKRRPERLWQPENERL